MTNFLMKLTGILGFCILLFGSCNDDSNTSSNTNQTANSKHNGPLFELLDASLTGIDFSNDIYHSKIVNYFTFMHLYIGAGVAVGDINNDGLQDIYFSNNVGENRLYLNKGDFKFEDITQSANVACKEGFKTGVSFADINNDGFQDIYLCRSGWAQLGGKKANRLFINNGDLTFTERSEEFGLDDRRNSIQASFFDYDKDGDLDLFVINTPTDFSLVSKLIDLNSIYENKLGSKYDSRDILYENQGGKFVDVSDQSGIKNDIGFGLSVLTADFDDDGWTDIYVGDDFNSPDYMYRNKGDGTFEEVSKEWLSHTSFYSMGSDAADINNDGLNDLFVLDMMPIDYKRSKTSMKMINIDQFATMNDMGYNYQYMHNMMHLNTGKGRFSEVSQMTHLDKSDWSWGCFISDLDNDGWKDVFATNGIIYEVTNRDYEAKVNAKMKELGRSLSIDEIMTFIPSNPLENFCFRNNKNLDFEDVSKEWGLNIKGFSNGAAVGDFDNDGDLDIITNNQNEKAFVHQNQSNRNYLKLNLVGAHAQNAKIYLTDNEGQKQFLEVQHTRGFLSASDMNPIFGLGNSSMVKSLKVTWNDGKENVFDNIKPNQTLTVDYTKASKKSSVRQKSLNLVKENNNILSSVFQHQENEHDDYKIQILLPHKLSQNGPFISKGDINKDGLEDFFIGGASGQAGALYIQNQNGQFQLTNQSSFTNDRNYEDLGSLFFDADGDQDLDLYVVSGGSEFPPKSPFYQDRLYLNDGNGQFSKAENALPSILSSCQSVSASDYDNDGDQDLFVGGRVFPEHYPYPTPSYLLINEGGVFKDVTATRAKDLIMTGMVTSSIWSDVDGDQDQDLIVVGEWMPIRIFINDNGNLSDASANYGLENTTGWWNKIVADDYDNDGDIDFFVGNLGKNHKFKANEEKPFHVYCGDYDSNGSFDIVLAKNYGGTQVPVRGRECTSEQMPFIKQNFPTFEAFADSDINQLFGNQLGSGLHYEAKMFESVILENTGSGFEIKPLPIEAQIAPINGIEVTDLNNDGIKDLVLGGNMFQTEAETSRADASVGKILLGKKDKTFESLSAKESGFFIPRDVKDIKMIKGNNKTFFVIANNDSSIQVFSKN